MLKTNAKPPPPAVPRQALPPLDLLPTFEAAARHLSFTVAAGELFLTQSAVSRQIQQIEANLGVALFERKHRSLELTEAGRIMQRAVTDCLERLRDATTRVRATSQMRHVAITCTPGFASLWLIPRLTRFTADHPEVDVRISATLELVDLERHQVDLAVRFIPKGEGEGAPLFEEQVVPLCSPKLVADKRNPLKKPADLANHTLLTIDTPQGGSMTVDWEPWLRVMGLAEVHMKNTVRFTRYTEAVAAAVAGQGVVIGRLPLMAEMVRDKRLVSPFGGGAASQRGYYVMLGESGRRNPDAHAFAQWLRTEADAARQLL
ncbi:LysR substrate-binding domain-containing protein [Ramlibacter sp. PS4R-6]|uniref:LysR substrate-binding domain-containing protein n=1 Tax=Ramlibacter sp. PS4R-6 TaxID=3133438 RepID=UPI0030A6171F